jgi:hypothetical protein
MLAVACNRGPRRVAGATRAYLSPVYDTEKLTLVLANKSIVIEPDTTGANA